MALVPAGGAANGGAPLPPPEPIASVPAAPGTRLFFTWGAGDQIRLCELQGPGADAAQGARASAVAWSTPSMEQRRIAYDVLPLYRQLRQALMQEDLAPATRLAVLRSYARGVRQILMAGGSDDPEDVSTTPYEAAVWHLLELFFLEPEAAEGHFAELYVNWLRLHGSLLVGPAAPTLVERVEELRASPRVEAEPTYWPTLRQLLAVGQLEAAGELLLAHSAYSADDGGGSLQRGLLERVYNLIRTTPRLRRAAAGAPGAPPLDGPSPLELLGVPTDDAVAFRAARGAWGRRVRQLASEGGGAWDDAAAADPEGARGLRSLLAIMNADERALRDACANWAELLAALLFWRFTDASPQLHMGQLLGSAAQEMAAGGGAAEANKGFLDFLQELLLLASRLEVQGVVRLATNSIHCGLWFVAHAYDVLRGYPRAEALFSKPLPHLGCDQAEMYTLHWVATLTDADGTWQVAAEYLAWCPVYGADAMEALLARLPFTPEDEPAALKGLALCARHGLSAAARALCGRLAARAADLGLPGAALRWALRGGDAARCGALAAPVVAELARQLDARSGSADTAPLDLPELDELAPLLDCLPPLAGYDAQSAAADCGNAARAGDLLSSGLPPSAAAAAAVAERQRLREQRAGGARVAYPSLQLLRACLRLQSALRRVASAHARQAAAAAAGASPNKQQRRRLGGGDGSAAAGAASDESELRAAYQDARAPVMDLVGLPLAPAPLRAPLLRLALPLLESAHAPFSRRDVQRLLAVLSATLAAQAAAAADGLPADGDAGSAGGGGGGGAGGGGGGGGGADARVGEVRLALARALVRAQILEASAEA